MAPTTLVTFLVRSPPSTRSVHLYGSWDNFTNAYPMQRDTRTGPEHWSGCHSFSNIICDGDAKGNGLPRQGGLKMGGTYWYYYKLDDEIEFHNSAEPSTTSCPMLPGQLVNVLNVPFALTTSSRSRNDSVSSISSDYRTMDPTDKFLNPRPVPAKPSLPRLKTSPTLLQQSWSSSSSPASSSSLPSRRGRSTSTTTPSQPGSANAYRVVRMKPSIDAPSRSTSRGSNRSVGIIGAFRALKSPRIASPEATLDRGRSLTNDSAARDRPKAVSERSITPKRAVPGTAPPTSEVDDNTTSEPPGGLALRRAFNDASEAFNHLPISSFAQHRRQRSLSREPSSLCSSIQPDSSPDLGMLDQPGVQYQRLATLKEVASATNTPVWPLTALKIESEKDNEVRGALDLEKRLPTLPNTPSSAYPPSVVDAPLIGDDSDDIVNLRSHFSSTTIETESYRESYIHHGHSRFSDWTDGTTTLSPQSELASSILDFEPISPIPEVALDLSIDNPINASNQITGQDHSEEKCSSASKQDGLPSALSFSTVSSFASTTPNSHVDLDSAKDGHFSWTSFQHYSLPSEDVGSGLMHKPTSLPKHVAPLVVDENHRMGMYQPQAASYNDSTIPHSTSMQQLLAELSYLGGMIQQH
ncbi:uncharacterized protein Z519_11352 [Cladophialophora bantiana CBS 173.52]|uniref:AMP-activated protein kinase glycogen-binding domain-containing protein n=1 Tax=Cladophialophora bantiana (strain ATCC 10958 / CBS 173.52 / CDC B-1940 / NIH 8579) TaxID=1442370 RepID=A0A0D2EDN3_CLAB1|nr:uncharacterized protein Z519_11352 [Cladophialophora bantiana CBS 173.52]KIW88241.1 hypothetical protein Z519_11352 [Cladophialophora bantiana CBS 173.52]